MFSRYIYPQFDVASLESGVMIETKNLTKKFNELVAVDHVSFNVKRGEIFGLLGFRKDNHV